MKIKHECSYCGGWDIDVSEDASIASTYTGIKWTIVGVPGIQNETVNVCFSCVRKGMDFVFKAIQNKEK